MEGASVWRKHELHNRSNPINYLETGEKNQHAKPITWTENLAYNYGLFIGQSSDLLPPKLKVQKQSINYA